MNPTANNPQFPNAQHPLMARVLPNNSNSNEQVSNNSNNFYSTNLGPHNGQNAIVHPLIADRTNFSDNESDNSNYVVIQSPESNNNLPLFSNQPNT